MPMLLLNARLPEIGKAETRSVTVHNWTGVPDGEYGFLELYCDDPKCDCRRVCVQVVRRDSGPTVWATISYGWESLAFYEQWTKDKELARHSQGIWLDPLNTQSPYAAGLLHLFNHVLQDENYAARLQKHYELFKADLRKAGRLVAQTRKKPVHKRRSK